MTAEQPDPTIALPPSLVETWPGRFRFGRLLVELLSDEPADADALAAAVLEGLVADHDEHQVVDHLLARGEFLAVQLAVDRPAAGSESRIRATYDRLGAQRKAFLRRALEECRRLSAAAAAADVELSLDRTVVEKVVDVSWPSTEAYLDQHRKSFEDTVAERAASLSVEAARANLAPGVRAVLDELIAKGQLKAARAVLDNGGMPDGPLVVPPMRRWTWAHEPPAEVLRWHLDAVPTPPSFSQWAPVDNAARRLLQEYDQLTNGGEQAARSFAEALDEFLGVEVVGDRHVSRVEGGFITTLYNAFSDPALKRFRQAGVIELFVADPGLVVPPDLAGVGPHIAVGSHLEAPAAGRTPCAVLTTESLLRLVTVGERRPVALVRAMGRQWPLSVFGVGTPVLVDLLAGDDAHRWEILTWILDLVGLPGIDLAEAVKFYSGYEPGLVYILLSMLVEKGSGSAQEPLWRVVGEWNRDHRWGGAVEDAVLQPIRTDPAAVALFWLALGSQEVGEPVDLDSMLLTAALTDDGEPLDDVLSAVDLSGHWFVDATGGTPLTLRRVGVLLGLQSLIDERLPEALSDLRRALAAAGEATSLSAWDVERYRLTRGWDEYRADATRGDEVAARAALSDVTPSVEEALAVAGELTGSADVTAVFTHLAEVLRREHPALTVRLHLPGALATTGHQRVLSTIGYHLLSNAAEAVNWKGTVVVSAELVGSDVLVDVVDDGPGLPEGHNRLFRKGAETGTPGRGAGLYLARQLAVLIEGDLELAARRDGHPVYRGAQFRLFLQRE